MAANNKCGGLRTLRLCDEKPFHTTIRPGKNEKNYQPALYSMENTCKTLRMIEQKFGICIKPVCHSTAAFYFENMNSCYNYSSQTFPLWASTLGTEVAQELSESLVPLTYHFWNYYQSHLAMHRRPATDCHPVLLWSHGVWELPFDMHETAFLKYLHNLLHRCWLYHPINRSYLLMAQAQSFSVDNYREAK